VTTDLPADEAADAAYLAQVRREIDEEVRRRRAAGDFLPSFERKLDELFARYTPTGEADDHFTEALKLADRAAFFDIDVPRGSRREVRGLVKWTLWQAEAWFVRYVVDQLNHFSAAAMRVLHLLDERLRDVERDLSFVTGSALADGALLTEPADPTPFVDELAGRLAGTGGRRVLHTECGDGRLLGALAAAGVDAYGVDADASMVARARAKGLDVECDDALGHLAKLPEGSLGAVFSSQVDEHLDGPDVEAFFVQARRALRDGGVLVAETVNPHCAFARKNFWIDLTHRHQVFPEVAVLLCRHAGFKEATVLFPQGSGELVEDLLTCLDYAIVATR
jgi:SAM-dependent methyltransferase